MYKSANARLSNAEVSAELNASVDHAHLYAEYQRLAAEQAALRRLATLVAHGVEPPKVFDAVASEMRRCVRAEIACLWRYETADEITLIAASYDAGSLVNWPVGIRTSLAGDTLAAVLQRTGRPARMDSYDDAAGALAARIRAAGIREAVGVPIMVDGRIWGLATVGSTHSRVLPADTKAHIGSFAELVATAVVAGYRDEQKRQILGGASRGPLVIDSLLRARFSTTGACGKSLTAFGCHAMARLW
jgi:GAF domain-containing protein